MKKLIFYLILIALQQPVFSQKVYFIYLQTDPQQPFYLKMNEKITSSSSSGYLILSKLIDSSYKFSIGFPENKWPEQAFSVSVNKKDHGYLVKNFGDKGWGLFDLQTLTIQMPVSGSAGIESPTGTMIKDESVFTDILSKAADDPSLKNRPVVPKPEEKKPVAVITEPVKKEEEKTVIKEPVTKPVETATVAKNDEQKTEIKEPIITPKEPAIIVTAKTEEPKTAIKEAVVTTKEPAMVVADKKEEPKNDTKETAVKTAEIKEPAVVKKEEVKEILKDTVVAKPMVETALDKKEEPKVEIKESGDAETKMVDQQTITEEEYRRSEVKKRSESSTTEGFGLVFIDDNGGGNIDTIRLLIPNPRPVVAAVKEVPKEEKKFLDIVEADTVKTVETKPAAEEKKPVVDEKKPAVEEKKPAVDEKIIVEEKKPLVKEEKPVVEEKITIEEKKPAEEKTVAAVVVNKCPSIAAEADFFKLRKKMAGITSDDNMISEARKIFKTKCFTSLQIKNLGYLFLSDEGKYKFFDAAYGYVSDKENFQSLQSELKDSYYLARFKAMLR